MRRIALLVLIAFICLSCIVAERHTTTIVERPMGIAEQVAAVRSSVVHVSKDGVCQGSGCILTPDGIIFSAKHVTDGDLDAAYTVTLDDGRKFKAKYALEDREADIAYLKLDLAGAEPNLSCARLAPVDTLRAGDPVFVFGSPLGYENFNTVSLGIVSALHRNLDERQGWGEYKKYQWHAMIQSTSPSFPGNSGGPCFNMRGEVVGVLVAGQAETLNFSVPVVYLREKVDTVRQWFDLCRLRVLLDDKPTPEPVESWYTSKGRP